MTHWNQDAAYALRSYKILAWPLGAWPIDDDTFFSKIRWSFAMTSEVRKSREIFCPSNNFMCHFVRIDETIFVTSKVANVKKYYSKCKEQMLESKILC